MTQEEITSQLKSRKGSYGFDGRDGNNICQEDFSMEILETEKRKMNKNKEKKKELTHFLEHYWIYAIILVIYYFILLHFLELILH